MTVDATMGRLRWVSQDAKFIAHFEAAVAQTLQWSGAIVPSGRGILLCTGLNCRKATRPTSITPIPAADE
jgi:hypothetical protein